MSKNARAVTDLRYYKNLTKKGNPSSSAVKKGINYYTFERDEEGKRTSEKRGEWYDKRGVQCTVPQMTEWVSKQAKENKYTYTAVLSLRDGPMLVNDFIQAMNTQNVFSDYRLIKHEDTKHDHAHVIMFRKKTLNNKEFFRWRRHVGKQLEVLEQKRLQERPQERTVSNDYSIEFEYDF